MKVRSLQACSVSPAVADLVLVRPMPSLFHRRLVPVIIAIVMLSCDVVSASQHPDYAKLIIGDWEGPHATTVALHQAIRRFHADGRWGVVPYGGGSEEIRGRLWRIEGNKLLLTYLDGRAFATYAYRIVSFTPTKLVLEIDGFRQEWDRVE
jgi:hypothetical protein